MKRISEYNNIGMVKNGCQPQKNRGVVQAFFTNLAADERPRTAILLQRHGRPSTVGGY
jgi:hypothetical protein